MRSIMADVEKILGFFIKSVPEYPGKQVQIPHSDTYAFSAQPQTYSFPLLDR